MALTHFTVPLGQPLQALTAGAVSMTPAVTTLSVRALMARVASVLEIIFVVFVCC